MLPVFRDALFSRATLFIMVEYYRRAAVAADETSTMPGH